MSLAVHLFFDRRNFRGRSVLTNYYYTKVLKTWINEGSFRDATSPKRSLKKVVKSFFKVLFLKQIGAILFQNCLLKVVHSTWVTRTTIQELYRVWCEKKCNHVFEQYCANFFTLMYYKIFSCSSLRVHFRSYLPNSKRSCYVCNIRQ